MILKYLNGYRKRGRIMIDFDQELKKFKPALGVDVGSGDLFDDDYKDITDLVEELVEDLKKSEKK